ncbi:MAG: alcohol dehydrogenase catalytic domain-containing protein [Bryobacteraceae bacterium]|nr:alcohol dehydrogenase catalytic domain-containing protein [Bryobacteraceae bacterium]
MRAIQLVSHRRMETVELPEEREPGPGEVMVRICSCGICGSDLHWWAEGGVGERRAPYPMVLGHEPAGEIVAVGEGVAMRLGDRVAIEPALTCGVCEFCRGGRANLCLTSRFMSSGGVWGLFREYATVPATNADPIPAALSYDQATLIEPLSVILHLFELRPLAPGETVAITGAGPIGMLAGAVARSRGAAAVIVSDPRPHRRALAEKMGAHLAVEPSQFAASVFDLTHGRGADLVIDAAAKRDSLRACFAAARKGADCILIGIPSETNLPVDLHAAMAKELRLQTIFRSNHNAAEATRLLAEGVVGDHLLTHRLPLSQTQFAFEMLDGYHDNCGKIVMQP